MNHDRIFTSDFLNRFRDDAWEFGLIACIFAILDRLINAFSSGLPSALALAQIFTISLLTVCWAFLKPTLANEEEAFYNHLKKFVPAPLPLRPPTPLSDLLQRYGYQQSSLWRGWRTHHTFFPNLESDLSIVFVHGFGGSIGHWRQNMSELAKHHNVYALDLLGFGNSDKPNVDYSVDLWVDQLYEFWQTFIGTPVVLVGNSIGSLTCLATAAAHPEMVRGVAMISLPDTASHEEAISPIVRPLVRSLQTIVTSPLLLYPLFHLLRQPGVVRRWASLAYVCQESVTEELLEILMKPAREQGSAQAFCAIVRAMISPQFSPSVRSLLSQIQMPSLLMWGDQDRMIPPGSAKRLLSYKSDLQLIELENAGHCAHDERPEQVNAALLSWIQTQILPDRPVAPCCS
ncbi:alpha/beta fold hydrolase [Phormidesmis priestleyi]